MCVCVCPGQELQDVIRVCMASFGSSSIFVLLRHHAADCSCRLPRGRALSSSPPEGKLLIYGTRNLYGGKASGKEFLQIATAQNQSLWAGRFARPVSFLKPDDFGGGTQNCSGSFFGSFPAASATAGSLARSLDSVDDGSSAPAKPNNPRSIQHRLHLGFASSPEHNGIWSKADKKIDKNPARNLL